MATSKEGFRSQQFPTNQGNSRESAAGSTSTNSKKWYGNLMHFVTFLTVPFSHLTIRPHQPSKAQPQPPTWGVSEILWPRTCAQTLLNDGAGASINWRFGCSWLDRALHWLYSILFQFPWFPWSSLPRLQHPPKTDNRRGLRGYRGPDHSKALRLPCSPCRG